MRKALLAPADLPALTIRFDGDPIPATARDTVASALIGAGELATSRSAKYRRPRGPACLRGGCGTCLVRIDGQPNQRACLTPAREGMVVESQNTYGALDPTALIDRVFRRGIDHHHMVVYPKIANQVMQGVARGLTGFGDLPDAPPALAAGVFDHAPEVMVVGAGLAGRALAARLAAAGHGPLVVDRRDREGLARLAAADAHPLPEHLLAGVGVFACYPHEGVWAGAESGAPRLHRLRPRHVVLAVGAHEPTIPLANNDLPGVVSARGLRDLLRHSGRASRARVLVLGEGPRAEALARELGAERVDPARVRKLVGARRVKAAQLDDGRSLPCDLVALAPEPAPAFELAAQAGARLRWSGAGFVPECDASGELPSAWPEHPLERLGDVDAGPPPAWTLWAIGELAGARTDAEILASAERCAAALLPRLAPAREEPRLA